MRIERKSISPAASHAKSAVAAYPANQRAGGGYTNSPVDVTSIKTLKQIFLSQDEPNF